MAFETGIAIDINPRPAEAGAKRVNRALDGMGQRGEKAAAKLKRELRAIETPFEKLRRGIFSTSGALKLFGAGFSIAVVLRGVRELTDTFSDFEKGLIGIGKTSDLTGSELERMGAEIQKIARVVPVATTELLAIGQAAGQLGVKGVRNIALFTETVGKLGLASNLAGEEAATTLARILTVTGTAISDVDRLGSTIVRLGNNFAATEAEIAAVANRVARDTAQFQTSAAEVAGIGAALRSVGVEAEAGGTVIGNAFQAINDAVRGGGDELTTLQRIMGQTGAEITKTFKEAPTEAFRQFVEGLGRIQNSGGDVSAALKSVGLEGRRAVSVLGTLATRSEVLGRALDQANAEWRENTALNREAATATTAFDAQMKLTTNTVDKLSASLGEKLAPSIVSVAKAFREFLQGFTLEGRFDDVTAQIAEIERRQAKRSDISPRFRGLLGSFTRGESRRLQALFGQQADLIAAIEDLADGEALAAAAVEDTTKAQIKATVATKDRAASLKKLAKEAENWEQVLQTVNDIELDVGKAQLTAVDNLHQFISGLQQETELARLSNDERETAVALRQAENLAAAGGIELLELERQEIRDTLGIRQDAARILAKETAATKKLADEQRKQAELMQEPIKNALSGIQGAFTETFEDIFRGGVDSFSDLADAAKNIFFRLAAELATLSFLKFTPIIDLPPDCVDEAEIIAALCEGKA